MTARRSHFRVLALALVPVALLLLAACGDGAPAAKEVWYCPMHPEVTSDKPGSCPICHMDLVKREPAASAERRSGATPGAGQNPDRILYYRHPMRPDVTSPIPAKDEMGMDYVAVRASDLAAPGGGTRISAAGIVTIEAREEHARRRVRTVGRVVADERRQTRVESRYSGWIAGLDANFTGRRVARGERLATIDSPELYAAQSEYLAAREAARRFLASSLPEVRRGGDDLILAARRRLELLDVPEALLEEIERTRVARRSIDLVAPAAGIVTEKNVVLGQRVEPGVTLFTLLDLSRVWVEADLYEADAVAARVGQAATITLAYDPAFRAGARVSYVFPQLDPATRTLRIRFDLANAGEALKPGMFVDVDAETGELAGVAVPDSAVMATGERAMVFVADGKGGFEQREVHLAGRQDGRTFVSHGLAAGERVAAEAAFLLDAETRLREASGGSAPAPAADGHEAHP